MSVTEEIRNKSNLTNVEVSIANYILNNLSEAAEMNMQELAESAYVSKPSVIRFFRKLGYKNYRDFTIALQLDEIQQKENRKIDDGTVFFESKTAKEYAVKMGKMSKQIIDNCIFALDNRTLNNIITLISSAERIFIFCASQLRYEVDSFKERIKDVAKITELDQSNITEPGDKDVIILATCENGTIDKNILKEYLNTHSKKILVSAQDNSLLRSSADEVLYTYPDGNDYIRNNLFVSQMSILFGLNIIYGCLLRERSGN